jgi:CheY-like chemotaxis protein
MNKPTVDLAAASAEEPANAAERAEPGVAPAPETATVLLVDGDAVSRRWVELALTGKGSDSCILEMAKDGAGALEILRTEVVDLIIAETELPDMNGLQFFRLLQQESRLRRIPFVFHTADARTASKVIAVRAGADDYLVKPGDSAELMARVAALTGRERRLREAFRARTYTLAGEFSAIHFTDLVVMLEMGRRTGMLHVATPRAMGEISFSKGTVVHAVFANLSGAEAFYRLMAEPSGRFEFSVAPCEPQVTINQSVTELIMEGARRIDTENAQAPVQAEQVRAPAPCEPTPWNGVTLVSATEPVRALAASLERSISDGFTLGELRLFRRDALAKWERSPVGRDRFNVLLLADLAAGTSALLPLAAAPNERWLVDALDGSAKVLGLAFFLRGEQVIDILLLDINNPGAFQKSLSRSPSVMMVAPPHGDFLAVGTRARVEIDQLVARLRPTLVLGIGSSSLAASLNELTSIRRENLVKGCVQGALGEGRIDLRSLLIEGLRLWGSLAPLGPTEGATG